MADPTTASAYQGIREEANRLNGIGLKLITVIPVELPAAEYPRKDDPNKPALDYPAHSAQGDLGA